ncbi:MAG: hypothetical protein WC243_03525 [Patescibacteria group bacterium]|jgi:predicted  nucleic acid-binding Zn-ribbon protein
MKRIRTAFSVISIFTLLSILAAPVFALDPIYQIPNKIIDVSKIDIKTVSCAIIKSSIDNRISNFNTRYNNHLEVYTKLTDRLEQMIEKWQGWGYETSNVEGDLDNLKEMIKEYKDDHEDLIAKLTAARDSCGSSSYSTKVTAAKEALKELRGDTVAIRNLYQSILRQHILELKNQETE